MAAKAGLKHAITPQT